MPKHINAETGPRKEVIDILQNKWRMSHWPSIRAFVNETKIDLTEFTVGRILVHGHFPGTEALLHLCHYFCSRTETIDILRKLGDQVLVKYIEPDPMSADARKLAHKYDRLSQAHQKMVWTMVNQLQEAA